MIPLIDQNGNNSSKIKLLFDPPCDFIKFLAKIQSSSTLTANNILEKLLSFIHLKIRDVFNIFSQNNSNMNEKQIKLMYSYSYKKESDWRTIFKFPCNLSSFIENWSTMGIYEQHGIFDETQKRIRNRFKKIFNYFDEKNINKKQIILQLLNINNNNHNNNNNNNNMDINTDNFEEFMYQINLINRSLTNDILPILENYIKQQNPTNEDEEEDEEEEEDNDQEEEDNKREEEEVCIFFLHKLN